MMKPDMRHTDCLCLAGMRAMLGPACLVIALLLSAPLALAQTSAPEPPVRIAIPKFSSGSTDAGPWAERLAAVLTADLARSQSFLPLEPTALVRERVGLNTKPDFNEWAGTGARLLFVGQVGLAQSDRLRFAFRLWDISSGEQLNGEQSYAPRQHWRRLAHVVADIVYSRITGVPGYFDTRIAFIERRKEAGQPIARLAVMDQDGSNLEYLTSGAAPVLWARFSPAAQQILYVVQTRGTLRLVLRDLQRGISERVGDFPGLAAAPRFSPDGHRVVMSLKQGGNANLYLMDLRTGEVRRLTETAAIDTQPAYGPAGRRIVFVSGRSGTQQLYAMGASGGAQQRISRGEGGYSQPVWSPRGALIAFVKRGGGEAYLGVMKRDGSDERLLTAAPDIDGVSWAPNGRVLVFSRPGPAETGGAELVALSLNGGAERVLETAHAATDPSWSPPLEPRR